MMPRLDIDRIQRLLAQSWLAPLRPFDPARSDACDALAYSMQARRMVYEASGLTGAEPRTHNHLLSKHGMAFCRRRKVGYCMAVVKDDDSTITWDREAMERATP